jgi:multiple sugar transport system permease protein
MRIPVSTRASAKSGAANRLRRTQFWLLFAGPGLVLYFVFVGLPAVMSMTQSLTNKNPFNPPTRWVGLENYTTLFHDPSFWATLTNTLILAVILVLVPNIAGLGIAMLLDRHGALYRALRSVFFTPVILSGVVVSVIWQSILADGAILDTMLVTLGIRNTNVGWLSDPDIALYSVATIIAWQVMGMCVVVYLAGLQTIPRELYEASSLDGAGPIARFRAITWPMLAPATTVNTVMLLITAFKTYDQIQVITNGGPGTDTTTTLAFNIVTTSFVANKVGYGAAYSVVLLVLVAGLSMVTLRYLQRREQLI